MRFFGSLIENFILRAINVKRELPLQLDITNACNLNCSHCYHSHHVNKNALTLKEWKQVLKQYKSLILKMGYAPSILICGGEPFVSPLLLPILSEVISLENSIKKTVRINILTNGTLIQSIIPAILEKLKEVSDLTLQISLEGSTPQTHDAIRGEGNFKKTIDGITQLRQHGFKIRISSVLSYRTLPFIESIFSFAKELKVTELTFPRLIEVGTAAKNFETNQALAPHDLKKAYERILSASTQTGIKSDLQKPLMHLIQPGLGRNGRFFEGLVVDYKGNILASSRSRYRLGHVFKEGLETVFFQNPILKNIRKGRIKECGACKFLNICGGDRNAAFASSGDYLGADPGCWLKTTQAV